MGLIVNKTENVNSVGTENQGIILPSEELLRLCSFKSSYGRSFNKLDIDSRLIQCVIADIPWINQSLANIPELSQYTFRVKTVDSVRRKVERHPGLKAASVFNDLIGLRLLINTYPEKYPDYFRVVDMRNGKHFDDGYRAVHLYYKLDNFHYQIEVQLWSAYDSIYNSWMHKFGYKQYTTEILKTVYEEYINGTIKNYEDYVRRLRNA